MPNLTLYLVDPYRAYDGWHSDYKNEIESIKEIAKTNLLPFKERVRWIYKKSENCASLIPPLDFIYIDGNHNYEFIRKDIELGMTIVKAGGIVGGHDYRLVVKRAVDEFVENHDITLYSEGPDWWFIR